MHPSARIKWVRIAGIGLLSLIAGAASAADALRTVSVSGVGEVRAEPDRASVTLGVESRKLALADARGEVTRAVEALLKLARELKIDAKHVRTTRLTVQPEYNWNAENSSRKLTGYLVSRQVEIDLRDLDKLGTLLERGVDSGANQIGDPQLDSSRRRELEREALTKAVEDARLNAETLAKAAGVKLGTVRTLSASSAASPPIAMPRVMMMKAEARDAGGTYQGGELNFNASVQAEYELLDR